MSVVLPIRGVMVVETVQDVHVGLNSIHNTQIGRKNGCNGS